MISDTEQTMFKKIRAALETINSRVQVTETNVSIWLFARRDSGRNLTFEWRINQSYPDLHVDGLVLDDCVDEFCRRVGWREKQMTQIAASNIIDGEAVEA